MIYYDEQPAGEFAGGGRQSLGEKLPDNFKVKAPGGISRGSTYMLTGAIMLHQLALEDFAQLARRAEEINGAIINTTCSINDGHKEVRQTPLTRLGDGAVSRLLLGSLGLCAPAAEQGCRSKQNC